MAKELNLAVIGLDTSHAIEYTRRLQAPDCPENQRVNGGRVNTCLRFSTPFQSEEGLDKRQKQLEDWGVKVTTDFDEAVAGCDALIVTINDPSRHLEYFEKCAELGKPIFLDKPLADNVTNGRAIREIARQKGVRAMSCSSLRFAPSLVEACEKIPNPVFATTYGPMGAAAAGSSIVWYGVHAFEMLERAMGRGARSVQAVKSGSGVVAVVEYPEDRRGVVELSPAERGYGGSIREGGNAVPVLVDVSLIYRDQLRVVLSFFHGSEPPVTMDDAYEVMAMLDAADRSAESGKAEAVG